MAQGVTFRDRDLGWKKLGKTLKSRKDRVTTVGVHADRDARSDMANNLMLAMVHEFGLGVEERSWLRDTIDANESVYILFINKLAGQVLLGRITQKQAIILLGAKVKADMKNRIVAGISPPNSEITKARKGSSTPLIDSSQFINSIDYEVGP
jgi:hypothetical protein